MEDDKLAPNDDQEQNKFQVLSEHDEQIAAAIVDGAFQVHVRLGPGLLELVYEVCLCHELVKRGFRVERQQPVPIVYDNIRFDEGFRYDVLVEDRILCEIKAVEKVHPICEAQLLSYLQLMHKRLGFIINFHSKKIKDGIRRYIV